MKESYAVLGGCLMEECHPLRQIREDLSKKWSFNQDLKEEQKEVDPEGEERLLDRGSRLWKGPEAGKYTMSSEEAKKAHVASTERTQCKLRLESQVRSENRAFRSILRSLHLPYNTRKHCMIKMTWSDLHVGIKKVSVPNLFQYWSWKPSPAFISICPRPLCTVVQVGHCSISEVGGRHHSHRLRIAQCPLCTFTSSGLPFAPLD